MKISAVNSAYIHPLKLKNKEQNKEQTPETSTKPMELRNQFNDYLLSFGARVDKGMNRFFNENKDRMPIRVRNLVEPMQNREAITPLEAQYYAFAKLEDADTVADIKKLFPPSEEPLFADLKEVSESKSKKGLLYYANEMSELYENGVLKSGEDLTVYLVKKVFLETKTIDEINQDLENDLIEDFKVYAKRKNPDLPLVRTSTLSALGIKSPDAGYMQSLRYTRDGYSDLVGNKIRKGLSEFINSLTPEQRTARAVKSTKKFEKWWNSFTIDEKMDLIADKEYQIEMLKEFKRNVRAEKKKLKEAGIDVSVLDSDPDTKPKTHTHVGSKELSQDDLFKMWAALNLQKFEASLSQADLDTLHLKRMVRLFNRWNTMTPEERTDYISKMKSGAEPARYAMISAWNACPEIIKELSLHLKENQVYKPADVLYSSEEFSKFQSTVMSEFWEKHPEFAEKLGTQIRLAHEKIETAIQNGRFEELKHEINRTKNDRKRQIEFYRKSVETPVETTVEVKEPDYKDEFREAYFQNVYGLVKSMPKNYFDDIYEVFLERLPEDVVRLWTKNLNGEALTPDEAKLVSEALSEQNNPDIVRCNRAIEAAMADSIYASTKNPKAYELSNSDVKTVMYHIERGESPIRIISHKTGEAYDFAIVNKKHVDVNRINQLYESYKKDLSPEEISNIRRYGFAFNNEPKNTKTVNKMKLELNDYLLTYGRSLNILFSDKSAYPPEVKDRFAHKFYMNMPEELRNSKLLKIHGLNMNYETKFENAKNLYAQRFPFMPREVVNDYFKEFKYLLEFMEDERFNIDSLLPKICKKRTDIGEKLSVAVLPKHLMQSDKAKYRMLAFEQAMADALYEASGNEGVYKVGFEMLTDKIELFSMATKFPTVGAACRTVDGGDIKLSLKKRVNQAEIKKKYNEYMQEISEWLEETKGSTPDYRELLYILNPEENNLERDMNCGERMATYFSDLGQLEISLHPNRGTSV